MAYIVLETDEDVEKAEAACFADYYAKEVAARGLSDGDGLDVRSDGTRVHVTVRYVEALRVEGVAGGLLPVDGLVRDLDGVKVTTPTKGDVTLDVVEVEAKDIPEKYREAIEPRSVLDQPDGADLGAVREPDPDNL
jgi:hypothetical protein